MIKKYYDCSMTKSKFETYNKNKNNSLDFHDFLDWLNDNQMIK